ncbi:MAG: hypothetical protein KatS3mg129_1793 [Leptospiraceae bacterium]|nr:MAG: hypothetical protein KatS3mg129_1793 [Leptospiraceae bacterium]
MSYNNYNQELEIAKQIVVNQIIERLGKTYKDYIENVKGFDKIPSFFRNHLYAPANKKERDKALEELYKKLKTIVGQDLVENVYKLIQLVKLSDELDYEIAEELLKNHLKTIEYNKNTHLDFEIIEKIIHEKNQYEKRKKQIDLICESLSFFFALSKLPLIKLVMAPIKVAANLVGAEVLVDTMEEGYRIAKEIKDMKSFIKDFKGRELSYLDSIQKKFEQINSN